MQTINSTPTVDDGVAYCLGGPAGILTSMATHPWMARRFGRKS